MPSDYTRKGTQFSRASCSCDCSGSSADGLITRILALMRSIHRRWSDLYDPGEKRRSCAEEIPRLWPACCICFGLAKPTGKQLLPPLARLFWSSFSVTCEKSADYPKQRLRNTLPS